GSHADAHLNTGGRYDPSADSWRTITTKGAPSKRCWHTLVWTGKEMIVWGGANTTKVLGDGGRYNPARDSWRPISTDGAPCSRLGHVAVWTGKEMIVWGGTTRERDAQSVYFENGARYDPEADAWRPISTIGAPKGRVSTFAVWTGTEMVIWGGVNDTQASGVNDPNRYVATGARPLDLRRLDGRGPPHLRRLQQHALERHVVLFAVAHAVWLREAVILQKH